MRDLLLAVRALRSSPGFTAAAMLTLALGVGASTAIFSVTNAVLLRQLPYSDPGRLVYACADMRRRNVFDNFWSNADYLDLRTHTPGLEDAAGVRTGRGNLPYDDGTPDEVGFATVTPNFFRVLGARIVTGRDFTENDALPQPAAADGGPVPLDQRLPTFAILSYDYFQRRLGGDPARLGQPLRKNGAIPVGVLEPGFELLFPPDRNVERTPELWVAGRLNYTEPRLNLNLRVIARLRRGVSLERAQAEADRVAEMCRAADPVSRTAGFQIRLEPMQAHLVAQVRPAILALMGAVVFLLLIACSNVANLFLVRASLRGRDLAVRTAMGATWWRLTRQMLMESLLVAAAGSAAGFALAWLGLRELLSIAPDNLPRLNVIRIDPSVLLFTIGAGLGAAVIFGLVPALRAARPDVAQVLRASGRTSGLSGGALLRSLAVVLEVGLCFVLLVGSGLMFRSFLALQKIDPGFDAHGVLTFRITGGRPVPTGADRAARIRQLHETLAAIPGVESATAADGLPLTGEFFPYRWGREDALADASKFQAADVQTVAPNYFEAMRTPLLAGRWFEESDNNPKSRHVLVDETMAAKAFPHQAAVGRRILLRVGTPQPEWFEISGVVAHQHLASLADPGREQAFVPDGFWDYGAVRFWAIRVKGDPGAYAERVREAVANYDKNALITHVETMASIVEHAQAGTRFSLLLIAVFAGIASILSGVGLYGVLSTVVRQRTAEIGVRMALGAAPGGIFSLIVGHGLRLSIAGVAAGLAAALLLTRVMSSMVIGIKPTDPLTYAGMALVFFAVAAAAAWVPARRAAAMDPSAALRQD